MTKNVLIAVDIGNSRIKCGRFDGPAGDALPEPVDVCAAAPGELAELAAWMKNVPTAAWRIASVNRPTLEALRGWIQTHRPDDDVRVLDAAGGGIAVDPSIDPDGVGVDRLLDARAADFLRSPEHGAVVVDMGSAITVDAVSPNGVFLGGSILPGMAMAARAMHERTDLLPLIDTTRLHGEDGSDDPPTPVMGCSTVTAMESGLFWGTVGAVRELANRMAIEIGSPCEIFLTGGASGPIAKLLGPHARYVPNLTLGAIALAAR